MDNLIREGKNEIHQLAIDYFTRITGMPVNKSIKIDVVTVVALMHDFAIQFMEDTPDDIKPLKPNPNE